jgi:hypothetical protein
MLPVTRRFHSLFNSSWIAFLGTVSSIVGLVLAAYLELRHLPQNTIWILLLFAGIIFFLGIGIYSIKVRQENRTFRNFMATLHRINHDYRDTLSAAFRLKPSLQGLSQEAYLNYLEEWEEKTLKSVCQKIAEFYSAFTHSKCTVTVKLIKQVNGMSFCSAYARSEENCRRDAWAPKDFELNTGRNTAFDRALMHTPATISHFHSWDLTSEKDYRNERDNWSNIYRSAIVVPIRSINPEKLGTNEDSDDIGFLCVDTTAAQRLNDTWHVELLAGFGDQMYNFICLMRGRYSLRSHPTDQMSSS